MTVRTVHITHPVKGEALVSPEVAAYQVRHGWAITGTPGKTAVADTSGPDQVPDPDAMPTKATDLVAWIGDDPDRAAQAKTAEDALGDSARSTVTTHIAKVLGTVADTSGPDQVPPPEEA